MPNQYSMSGKMFRGDYNQHPSEPCWNAVCIPLTNNFHALIDAEDYDLVVPHWWNCRVSKAHRYATKAKDGKTSSDRMHRMLLPTDMPHVDHINGNTLDNRKSNLRGCYSYQNQHNRTKTKGSSKFKGVSYRKRENLWCAQITRPDGIRLIKRFPEEEAAARYYDQKATEFFGPFARLNFGGENVV